MQFENSHFEPVGWACMKSHTWNVIIFKLGENSVPKSNKSY